MTGASKGFQKRLCKKRMWWRTAGELINNRLSFGIQVRGEMMQRETMPSLWHCMALRGVMVCIGLNGMARDLRAEEADKRRLWIGAWTLGLGGHNGQK
jgi:hypothetical protein